MNRILLPACFGGLFSIGLLGCTDLSEGKPQAAPAPAAAQADAQPAGRAVMAPAGLAVTGDIDDLARSGRPAPAANPQPQPEQPAEPQKRTGSILGKTTNKIVDLAEAKKNPKMVEVGTKITGSDPLTASFNAYVSITTRANVLNFKHQMDIMKAANDDKYPTFKECEKLMKELKIELSALLPYQLYAYDQKSGGLVTLEDKALKIQLYKANDIPIEEGDKQYDMP